MDAREAIVTRRSVRGYNSKSLGISTIEEIIDAGRYAPSSGNVQTWNVIVVTDEKMRDNIANISMKQSWISQAPVLLVVCSDKTMLKSYYGEKADKYCIQNVVAAVENMLIRANSLGVSSCWVDTFENNALKRHLKIPDEITPEIIITLGYSDEKSLAHLKTDLNKIVYFDSWGKFDRKVKLINELKKQIKEKIKIRKKTKGSKTSK